MCSAPTPASAPAAAVGTAHSANASDEHKLKTYRERDRFFFLNFFGLAICMAAVGPSTRGFPSAYCASSMPIATLMAMTIEETELTGLFSPFGPVGVMGLSVSPGWITSLR